MNEQENVKEDRYLFSKFILMIGWYLSVPSAIIMVIMWIVSFFTKDSSLYFKINIIVGLVILVINFLIIGSQGNETISEGRFYRRLYIVTGILMIINLFFLPSGVLYLLVGSFVAWREKVRIEKLLSVPKDNEVEESDSDDNKKLILESKNEDDEIEKEEINYFEEAKALVIDMQTASIALLQRRFQISYSRAAQIMDELEAAGVVGPSEGSKPRKVLIEKSEDEDDLD